LFVFEVRWIKEAREREWAKFSGLWFLGGDVKIKNIFDLIIDRQILESYF
jgi:hypothetical protein